MMMKMSLFTLMISPMMKHPMSLGLMLMNQTIILSMIMSTKSKISWFSYILFITMIGGLMIMFMYMSSIASNEKFKKPPMKLILMTMMIIISISIFNDQTTEMLQNMEMNKLYMMENEELKSTSKFFNFNKMNLTICTMMILLLTMVSVTNISNSFEGPLKKTYV